MNTAGGRPELPDLEDPTGQSDPAPDPWLQPACTAPPSAPGASFDLSHTHLLDRGEAPSPAGSPHRNACREVTGEAAATGLRERRVSGR